MDEETKQWLEAEKARAAKEIAETAARYCAESEARHLVEARRFLGKLPPALPGHQRRFVRVVANPPPLPSNPLARQAPMTVEGIIFDRYEIMSGHMDGGDNFMAFRIVTADEKITSWRDDYPDLQVGKAVRIQFVPPRNGI